MTYKQTNVELLCLEAFRSSGFLTLNKTLVRKFGITQAFLLSNYLDKYQYFKDKYNEDFDGWFFLTHGDIAEEFAMEERTVKRIKQKLIQSGILISKMKGLPAKEWFLIDFEMLINLITGEGQSGTKVVSVGGQKIVGLRGTKKDCLYNNNKGNNTKYNNNKEFKDTNVSDGSMNHPAVDRIIKFWNRLENTQKHMITESSKTYNIIASHLNNLLTGKPLLATKSGLPHKKLLQFAEEFEINQDSLYQTFTKKDIKNILAKIVSHPNGKPYNLQQVLWNGFAQTKGGNKGMSLFLLKQHQIKKSSPCIKAVRKLYSIINPSILENTPRIILESQHLRNNLEISFEDLNLMLDFYAEHKNEKYIPIIRDTIELIQKLPKLQSAYYRLSNQATQINKDPIEILESKSKTNFDYTLLHKVYIEAASNITDCNRVRLAEKITGLYLAIEKARPENYDIRVIDLSAGLVQKYSHWLFNSDWITEISENSFDINSGLFKKYVREFKEEIGVHPLTGR